MRRLRKAYLEITNVCNLACDFCPGTRRVLGFLSPEGFRTLASRLRPHTDYLYLHLMGEPLLHPQHQRNSASSAGGAAAGQSGGGEGERLRPLL